jgi:hypothetical protein
LIAQFGGAFAQGDAVTLFVDILSGQPRRARRDVLLRHRQVEHEHVHALLVEVANSGGDVVVEEQVAWAESSPGSTSVFCTCSS